MRCKECGYPISADQSRMLIFDCPLCGARHIRRADGESKEMLAMASAIRDMLLCSDLQEAERLCDQASALFPFSGRVKFYQHAVSYAQGRKEGLLAFLQAAHRDLEREWLWDIFRVTMKLMNSAEEVLEIKALEQFIAAHVSGLSGRLYLAAVQRVKMAHQPVRSIPLELRCPENKRIVFTLPAEETDVILGRSNTEYFKLLQVFMAIGRIHCRLFFHQGAWHVEDQNSRGGTCWNTVPLAPFESKRLGEGDVLCLSSSLNLVVHYLA